MSESLLSNPLKFETNPYHNVVMKDRKSLDLTGVKQIDRLEYIVNKKGPGKESFLGKLLK